MSGLVNLTVHIYAAVSITKMMRIVKNVNKQVQQHADAPVQSAHLSREHAIMRQELRKMEEQ